MPHRISREQHHAPTACRCWKDEGTLGPRRRRRRQGCALAHSLAQGLAGFGHDFVEAGFPDPGLGGVEDRSHGLDSVSRAGCPRAEQSHRSIADRGSAVLESCERRYLLTCVLIDR